MKRKYLSGSGSRDSCNLNFRNDLHDNLPVNEVVLKRPKTMDEPAKKLREALEKFIKHVDDLIEKDDPGGNGFHGEYRVC